METTSPGLTVTHRSTVTEDQIDHLGHMNVRFYGVNAAAGTRALLADLGVAAGSGRVVDLYTRHLREQLLGAELMVRSGVVEVVADGVRLYHELVNEATGELAAAFVHRVRLGDVDPAVAAAAAAAAAARIIAVPPHGAPRSIALDTDPLASAPGIDRLRELDLAVRKERAVTAEECDAAGDYQPTMAAMLVWGGEPVDGRFPPLLHDGPNGERMGWASMETRMVVRRLPRLGERIQSFSAVTVIADKVMQNIMWAYAVGSGELLTTFEVVNLAFDVNHRRPMPIPDRIRAYEERIHHPELAPRVTG
jgi:acyl-CoA thioester hydrolase